MFFWDGFPEALRRHWQMRVNRVAGAAVREGMLYVVGLERLQGGFSITFLESVLLRAEASERAQDLAEKIAVILARKGWERERLVFSIPAHAVEHIETMLPQGASASERAKMAQFEAVRQLHLGAETFFACAVDAANGQEIAVLQRSHAMALKQAFARAGIDLWALSAPPETFCLLCEGHMLSWEEHALPIATSLLGEDGALHRWDESYSAALYGAALLVKAVPEEGFVFPLAETKLSHWAYGRMTLAMIALWLFLLVIISAWDGYAWYAARQEAKQQKAEIALLYGDAQRMEEDRKEAAWIEQREQELERLTKEQSLATGVLVHLGKRNVEGVRLDEISIKRENPVLLKGEAVTFGALSAYLQEFERDDDFFPDGPRLVDSTRPAGEAAGTIHFSIELEYSGEADRDASQGIP